MRFMVRNFVMIHMLRGSYKYYYRIGTHRRMGVSVAHSDRLTDVGHNCKVAKVLALGLLDIFRLQISLTDSSQRCRNRRNAEPDKEDDRCSVQVVIMQLEDVICNTRPWFEQIWHRKYQSICMQ